MSDQQTDIREADWPEPADDPDEEPSHPGAEDVADTEEHPQP